ncbi:AAA family ATPase [Devosia sp. FKR38]|uniref:AAA family ATPase n=1 Tax=Devosia sp. FKR38 TaxID=2562312 RepID=UPI0020C0C2F1|nr:AAA family ATPase [Devosia sp. FKR38]
MQTIPPLADLGRRIMILGPTNSGKSTLADAMARKLGIEAIHLDVFSHIPGTNWVPRDKAEFRALHDAATLEDAWVMDGNYTDIMPQRFARATGVIVIDDHFLKRYVRYFRRTLFQKQRVGALPGSRDSVKWLMINWIWKTRNAGKYRRMAAESGLPSVICHSLKDVNALYAAWALPPLR